MQITISKWTRQFVDMFKGHGRHFNHRPERVAFHTTLDAEQSDRIGMVQMKGNLSARDFPSKPY
jgi:hypothetical protein